MFAGRLDEREREAWLAAIAAQPRRFVAQPKVVLGSAPVLHDEAVVPGTVVVRAQLVASGSGWVALPGGFGRVVDGDSPVLTQTSGTAKDVWVPADERGATERLWSAMAPSVPQIDLRSSMPSRVAEALFWLGRNAERAESTARLALALLSRADQSPELTELAGGAWVERTTAGLRAVSGGLAVPPTALRAGSGRLAVPPAASSAVRHELAAALGERPGALADSLGHLTESAGSVREYLSTGTWRVVATWTPAGWAWPPTRPRPTSSWWPSRSTRSCCRSWPWPGLAAESIVRGPGWRFLDLGRRLERAMLLLGLVEAMVVPATDAAAVQPVYETLLTACESLFAYRRRYRSDLELDPLCELLLGDDTNPRSLAFQLDRLGEDMASLPDRRELHQQQRRVDDADSPRADRLLERESAPQPRVASPRPPAVRARRPRQPARARRRADRHLVRSRRRGALREARRVVRWAMSAPSGEALRDPPFDDLPVRRARHERAHDGPPAAPGHPAPGGRRGEGVVRPGGRPQHHPHRRLRQPDHVPRGGAPARAVGGDGGERRQRRRSSLGALRAGAGWDDVAGLLAAGHRSGGPAGPGLHAGLAAGQPVERAGRLRLRRRFPAGRPLDDAVRVLAARIHDEFAFDPAFSDVSTPLADVLAARRGVCQDFAHLSIGCLRSLGLPCRYVSGYLETQPPPGHPRLVGADASHAWAAVYIPGCGWLDFDPTNDQVPPQRHITVAWGATTRT